MSLFVGELFVFFLFFWSKKMMNFENFEHRSVIKFLKFLTKEGIEPKDIYQRLVNVYRDHAPSKTTIVRWAGKLEHGRESIYTGLEYREGNFF